MHIGQTINSSPVAQATIARRLLGVAGFVLLIGIAAQVRIPLPYTPVPMTLQLPAVLLAGFCLSPVSAVLAVLGYLTLGSAGAPLFALGSFGLAGVTGGYLIGFVVAAGMVSILSRNRRGFVGMSLAGLAGTAAVLALGTLWLVGLHGTSWSAALTVGVLPFVPKAVVEVLMLVAGIRVVRAGRRPLN